MQSHIELGHGLDHSMGIPKFFVCELNKSRNVETTSFATLQDLLCDNTLDGGGFKTFHATLNLLQSFKRC
jgi:hypothetical protein